MPGFWSEPCLGMRLGLSWVSVWFYERFRSAAKERVQSYDGDLVKSSAARMSLASRLEGFAPKVYKTP